MRSRLVRSLVAGVAAIGLTVASAATGSGAAIATTAPLPAHVYAPYFETWTTDSISTVAQRSGARYLTLAFLETLSKSSCTLAWNGSKTQTVATAPYLSDIASLRAIGGDVIPSFGGWSADQGGTEIGDSCKDVNAIAAAYESVVTTYGVTRLDMDIEGRSLTKPDGIDRRNKAIKVLQDWASATGRTVQIQYTVPTTASGLESSGLAVLQNAVDERRPDRRRQPDGLRLLRRGDHRHGRRRGFRVAGLARTAPHAPSVQDRRAALGDAGGDHHERTRRLPAQDRADRSRGCPAAPGLRAHERHEHAIDVGDPTGQRSCPGVTGANDCSGIVQNTWDFSRLLEPFTG